jgi:hypothetical protein
MYSQNAPEEVVADYSVLFPGEGRERAAARTPRATRARSP